MILKIELNMKAFILFYFMLIILGQPIFSQQIYHLNDIQNASTITWFGLDFSKAKLGNGFNHPKEVKQAYISGWNEYVISPQADIRTLLKKKNIYVDLSVVTERNLNFFDSQEELTRGIISQMIEEYTLNETEGIGLVFIVDSFDKSKEKAYVWVTFFDIALKKVLLTERVSGKTKRGSMVIHWGMAILDIMSNVPAFYRTYSITE
ncbi:MAG: hypothetical protein NTX61_15675 [Bacteroidetes bacterium]|nr:hypothetical protein [Bacteroidota bacterium]